MSILSNDEIKEQLFEEFYSDLENTRINGVVLSGITKYEIAVQMAEDAFLRRQ